ncbi:protein PET100 homolog, mitochondrial [Adelges cooleyi]|uniref:protein PET100 homolog, mitochondrial n=1 Tax=Adelges cooleyi TaxID=133065 RepID=UPI00217FC5B7|nr:protein PET100 homolog, mitochondrial [Adelges cooleyi]XP_050441527.1 protein PET100 homolog, mitochondrial [Adelges cooleyi]XP_050441528.1 protein PET100 homolog, mitochondrial [Adelges cooleyi]
MGKWQLEVARMVIYMAFPVVLFHYFNLPENYEEKVIRFKRENFPPERQEPINKIEELKRLFQERQEEEFKKVFQD